MMKVKKFLHNAAKRDKDEILNSDKSKSILNRLLYGEDQQNIPAKENAITCPDCGNLLVFNENFKLFMHTNCEELNCWYAADEFKKCVDNNEMRKARIAKFTGLND